MTDVAFWPALKLIRALRARKLGALELLELYAARIERYDPKLNALCVLDLDAARKRARAFDRASVRKGARQPLLAGLPMTVKESFDLAGHPTTWGLEQQRGNVARRNALAVERLLAAGANVFGKSNVPVMLADWETNNPVYGRTVNPWDASRTPGGSSGGAAAALAAGLTALELGSDIGGSIRNPAHYCGVYGHKPTWGICSMQGHALPGMAHPADISAIGPLARGAADLELALSVVAGADAIDGAGWKLALPAPRRSSLRGLRAAVLATHPTAETDRSVQDAIERLAGSLSRKGARVSARALPAFDLGEAHRVFIQLLRGATSGRQTPEQFAGMLAARAEVGRDDDSYYAQMVRANTQPHKDWLAASNRRHQMRLAWSEFFRDWDVLLCPNAASAAFPHSMPGERWERMITVNGAAQPATTQMWWAGMAGMCYLPATAAPIGLSPEGLPLSVQIVGPQHGDLSTIRVAQLIERELYAFVPPPGVE
ncbi:MAG TPA: amidase [Burkholderiales bacterium]|nr:amidase [Burkholderiales bacterium]